MKLIYLSLKKCPFCSLYHFMTDKYLIAFVITFSFFVSFFNLHCIEQMFVLLVSFVFTDKNIQLVDQFLDHFVNDVNFSINFSIKFCLDVLMYPSDFICFHFPIDINYCSIPFHLRHIKKIAL